MFNIVLVEPQIPQNTGNISRTCAVTGAALHLIYPLGFSVEDRYLKRSGLDYWNELEIYYYDSFEDFEKKHRDANFYLFSTHAVKNYCDVSYRDGDFLIFGKETAGLGKDILSRYPDNAVRIPMRENLRSLNLSNSAAIALYEALRQTGFSNLASCGDMYSS